MRLQQRCGWVCGVGTEEWRTSVVGGPSRLCPFATRHPVTIEICTFLPDPNLDDYAWFVFKAARELQQASTKDDSSPSFRSTLVVFPHYNREIGDLYEKILDNHKRYIGGVNDIMPVRHHGQPQLVQAIPFEGYDANEMKHVKGLPTRPMMAMAPWTTIQLIRYSDFAKIPAKVRKGIMKSNDSRNEKDPVDWMKELRRCRNIGTNDKTGTTVRSSMSASELIKKRPLPLACKSTVKRKRKTTSQS